MQYGFEIFGGIGRSGVCDCFVIVGEKIAGVRLGGTVLGFFLAFLLVLRRVLWRRLLRFLRCYKDWGFFEKQQRCL